MIWQWHLRNDPKSYRNWYKNWKNWHCIFPPGKQAATTPSAIWNPTSCSIRIPIQALRQLRLRWAQRSWIRRQSQTPFHCFFGLPRALGVVWFRAWFAHLPRVSLPWISGAGKHRIYSAPALRVWEKWSGRDICLNVWTPYRHQRKYVFLNDISATCPTNTHIQSMAYLQRVR